MADEERPVRTPEALVDFGRAVRFHLPQALRRTNNVAAQIRAVASPTNTKPKGG